MSQPDEVVVVDLAFFVRIFSVVFQCRKGKGLSGVRFAFGHKPWDNLPLDPEQRLPELRRTLREWREMLPEDYSGVTDDAASYPGFASGTSAPCQPKLQSAL